jgi:hypothetical protein
MDESDLKVVARFSIPYKAYIAKGRLEAEGIAAFVFGDHAPQRGPAGIRLAVPKPQAERALQILEELPGLFEPPGLGKES